MNNSTHSEAPASVTLSVKSPKGFDVLFTLRNDDFDAMIISMLKAEAVLFRLGYTAKGSFGSNATPEKPAETIAWDMAILCDQCKSPTRVISGISKKTNKPYKMRVCQKNKQGCEFVTFEH